MKLVVSYLIYPVLSLSFLFLFGPNFSSLPSPLGSVLMRELLVKAIFYIVCFLSSAPQHCTLCRETGRRRVRSGGISVYGGFDRGRPVLVLCGRGHTAFSWDLGSYRCT